jgi:RNA polymerase sigma-70 factor (ECF subfamily)
LGSSAPTEPVARHYYERRAHSEVDYAEPAPSGGFYASKEIGRNDRDPTISAAVRRAQAGESEALRFLYLRYKDNVYGYVLSILRDQHEAEDVTQQVFLKLMSVIHKYEPRQVPFTAWIIRVARNMAVDHQRQRRAIPRAEIFEPSDRAEDALDERRRSIEHALEALPEDQRGVVVLRHLVGMSPGEIADHLGRSEASIHGLHHRARQALKRKLEDADCTPMAKAA